MDATTYMQMAPPPGQTVVTAALAPPPMAPVQATYAIAQMPGGMMMMAPAGSMEHMMMTAAGGMIAIDPAALAASKVVNAKRPWTEEEDKRLLEAITKFGAQRWPLIASMVARGRAGKQCRERWFNHLCPAVKKGEWTEEEDRIIQEGVQELGTKWSEIVKRLPGRTDNAIKNRFNSQQRRLQRRARAAVAAQHPSALGAPGSVERRKREAEVADIVEDDGPEVLKKQAVGVLVPSPRRPQVVQAQLVQVEPSASASTPAVVSASGVPPTPQADGTPPIAEYSTAAEAAAAPPIAAAEAGAKAEEPPLAAAEAPAVEQVVVSVVAPTD
jgi:hypothetical protein